MRPVPRRNAHEGGFVQTGFIELLLMLFIYGFYLSMVLRVANRLQPRGSPAWWAIVLGPFAVCLLAAGLHSVWCWRKGRESSTFLNATALMLGLELLVFLLVFGKTVWQWLT